MLEASDPRAAEIVSAAGELTYRVLGPWSGDVLNHVNGCTALQTYLPSEHPLFGDLAGRIGVLPASHGARPYFDALLRFSTCALLGRLEIPRAGPALSAGLAALTRENERWLGDCLDVDLLLEIWKRPETGLKLGRSQQADYLFGQYVSRLASECGVDIEQNVRASIVRDGLLGYRGALRNSFEKRPARRFYVVSHLLLGAVVATRFGYREAAGSLVSDASELFERWSKTLEQDGRTRSDFVGSVQLGFIGLNLRNLEPDFGKDLDHLRSLFEKWFPLEGWKPGVDHRVTAIRLAGARLLMAGNVVDQVRREMGGAAELDFLLQLRDHLREAVGLRSRIDRALEDRGRTDRPASPRAIHGLIRELDYKPVQFRVRSPLQTLQRDEGDCKAMATLASLLLLLEGEDGDVCFFFGQDLQEPTENHVFVEWVDRVEEKRFPIDHTDDPGEIHPVVSEPDAVVRYPLGLLVKQEEDEILNNLAAKRARARRLARTTAA